MDSMATILEKLFVYAIPLVLAITVHEAAHAYMAKRYGDNTAKNQGRLTLNPVPHIDLVGTIILPLVLLATGAPFLFGWAKPVPINSRNFTQYRMGMRMVAIAGPASNLLMMIAWALLYVLLNNRHLVIDLSFFVEMAKFGIIINAVLCVFNLLPIPPLDGSRVVDSFLSHKASVQYMKLEPYGFFILIGGLFLGLWSWIIGPSIYWLVNTTVSVLAYLLHLLHLI